METENGVVVAESALLCRQEKNRYGSVPGLDDDELADPDELERQVFIAEFGPILALPVRGRRHGLQPSYDEQGHVDWGAFGTVDFERGMPTFDKTRYKLDRLREKRQDVLIMVSIVARHLPVRARGLVLRHLRLGVIDLDHIVDPVMVDLAQLIRRAKRLENEIRQVQAARAKRRNAARARLLERLDDAPHVRPLPMVEKRPVASDGGS